MKTKGIPIWERHLEHIVLGLAVLVFIGFTALQFIGSPNSVEVQGAGKVGPGQIDELLQQKASVISQKIDGPAVEIPPPTPVLNQFAAAKETSISPSPTLVALAPKISPISNYVLDTGNRPFVIASVPAPHSLISQQYFDTLSEETVTEFPDLQSVLPPSAPYDISWITLASTFDAGAVLRQFSQPGPNGEAPLPPKWYGERVDFIDVVIEREELVDGTWTASTLLEPIPGQLTFRPLLTKRIDSATRDEILYAVSDTAGRNRLIQPEFYTGAAAVWAPPNADQQIITEAATPEEIAIAEIRSILERAKEERDRIDKAMKDANCPAEAPSSPSAPGAAPSGSVSSPGESGGMSGGRSLRRPDASTKPVNERVCKNLRAKLKKLNDQIAAAEKELAKLTDEPIEPPVVWQEDETVFPDKFQIWGHDINIQPGKTYRYRFTVKLYNPLFARKNDLMPAQQHMAEQFTLDSQASEWSAPITAQPPLRIFVVEARPASQNQGLIGSFTLGNATAEVYRFRDGRWWQDRFTIYPGDRVGGTKSQSRSGDSRAASPIDYSTDWFLLDVVEDIAADRNDANRNWAATVLLQSLSQDGLHQMRSPRRDAQSFERDFLRQEVRSAEIGDSVASVK